MKLGPFIVERRENILKIAKAHGATNLKIFGSYARGDEHPGSDIDLLVELEPGRSLLDIIAIKQDIEDASSQWEDINTGNRAEPDHY